MKVSVKQEWIRRLRSGEYTQGHGTLLSMEFKDHIDLMAGQLSAAEPNSGLPMVKCNCCLGVLCEVLGLKEFGLDKGGRGYEFDEDFLSGELSLRLLRKVGLTTDQQTELIQMNDTLRYSFRQISDWIKVYVPEEPG